MAISVSSEYKVPGKQEVVVARQEHDLLQVALPARPPEYRIAINTVLYVLYIALIIKNGK